MYPAARNVFVALATVVMFAALADAATPDKALGTFPGCEWRYRPQNPDSKLWLYCPDKAGKWKRAYFGDDFDPHTVEQARAGDAKAIGILGNVYMNTSPVQDTSRGLALLRQASDMGDNVATRSLALNFLWSALNKPENKTEEVRLLRIAAERGDAESMRILGYNYGAGWGVDADNVEAARWYRKSAEKGNALAMLELGKRCFAEGCPAVDVAEGLLWLRAAADAGNAEAMYRLAEIYESGKGTTKDPAQSTNWQTRGDAAYVANLIAQAIRHRL